MSFRFPWISCFPKAWILNLATLGPVGYWGRAPGTLGSIIGIVVYTLFFYPLPALSYLILLVACLYVTIAACDEAEKIMQKPDPSSIILDECMAMPVCFMGLEGAMYSHSMWLILLAGLALFRFFDILKPMGIKYLQKFEGGIGIVVDDLAAAFATCVTLHIGLLILG